MADEVKATEVTTPVEAPAVEEKPKRGRKESAAPAKAATKKRGPKPKAVTEKKTTAKRGAKKTVKAPVTKAPVKAAPKYTFTRTVFEYQKIQYTEEIAQKKVLEYMEKHPYIKAEKIETFINFDEHKIFFTVDGYSNPDFILDL